MSSPRRQTCTKVTRNKQLTSCAPMPPGCNLIDVILRHKAIPYLLIALSVTLAATAPSASLRAQTVPAPAGPPPSGGGVFPLSEVHRGLKATAWTVFTGTKPEPMDVEILGVLRGARGPGHDMILAQLHGTKPEYTGVVAGMSGSPVYVGSKLLGSLSYRIGQFSKDPIAGITPIAQMLEVRDLPMAAAPSETALDPSSPTPGKHGEANNGFSADGTTFRAMETPLVMSGFRSEAIKLWQQRMEGTGLEMVAAGDR